MTHTPGPWLFQPSTSCIVDAAGRTHVAIVCRSEIDKETTKADARLIAAAPDMLNALKAVRLLLCGDMPPDTKRALSAARAAIKAAEGD